MVIVYRGILLDTFFVVKEASLGWGERLLKFAILCFLGMSSLAPAAASSWLVDGCGRGGLCGGLPTVTRSPTPTPSPAFSATASPTRTPSPAGTPATPTLTPTFSVTPTTTRTPVGGALVMRLDVGASTGHSDGIQPDWVADQAYGLGSYGYSVGGSAYVGTDSVSGTSDPGLYQSYRMGSSLEYFFTVPNGKYQVTLHFCDLISTAAGQNNFSTTAQGVLVLDHLDVFAAAGGRAKPYRTQFDVTVGGGVLLLQMAQQLGSCFLSAIEIRGLQQKNPLTLRILQPSNAVLLP